MSRGRPDVVVVGSGFAGTILARVLASKGLAVTVLDRARHPRFALGESSTPLGNLALERLARRYGLEDLRDLAAWGRWRRRWPQMRRGLKRGFTFFDHAPGRPYANGAGNEARLLVAASPNDEVADSHWLREDVDAFLARRARAEGVTLVEGAEVTGVEVAPGGARVVARVDGARETFECALVVDASGPAGVVAEALGVGPGPPLATRSGLLFAHLDGVPPFADTAAAAGAALEGSPYPDDLAAVHHLTPEGWVYALRFDDGRVSAGLLTPGERASAGDGAADALWEHFLGRYPSLAEAFGDARTVEPWRAVASVQHRRAAAAGPRWAALPHAYAFVDPLFSTGIAWSLLAVERLGGLVTELGPDSEAVASGEAFRCYADLLEREAGQIDRLVAGAYAALGDFERFAAHSLVYFAAVSWAESAQRLVGAVPGARRPPHCPGGTAAWDGFLGVCEPVLEPLIGASAERLTASRAGGEPAGEYAAWVRRAIASRDLVGLDAPRRPNLYPADLELLVERAPKLLGISRGEVLEALPRLRGTAGAAVAGLPAGVRPRAGSVADRRAARLRVRGGSRSPAG